MTSSMQLPRILACGTLAIAAALAPRPTLATTLYINANIAAANQNAVLAYRVAADGSLSRLRGSPFPTEGTGYQDPSYKLGPFDHDQEFAIDDSSDVLYTVNGGSDTISAFTIAPNGGLSPVPGQPFRSGGNTPVSLGLRGSLLSIINNAGDPAQATATTVPSFTAAQIGNGGRLRLLPHDTLDLPAADQPSQALTTHTAPFIFNTSQPNDPSIQAFYQYPNGALFQTDKVVPPAVGGVQPFPLGLWASTGKPYLYVGLDFLTPSSTGVTVPSKLGVYKWSPTGQLTLVRYADTAGEALCWIRATKDGKYLYTSNTFDNSISVFDATKPDAPVEIQHLVVGGAGGFEQLSLTPDEKFLYVLEEVSSAAAVGKSNFVHVLAVDKTTGLLTLQSNLTLKLPVSATTRPFGLVIH